MTRPKKTLPAIPPTELKRRSWNPTKMTPEENAAMLAAATKVLDAWALLQVAMIAANDAQRLNQGNKVQQTMSHIHDVHHAVEGFIKWLMVNPSPVVPDLPPLC